MANFYQIGPMFEIGYHLYPAFELVPNAERAQFGQNVSYDDAQIPDEVPPMAGGYGPAGFRKGDAYNMPSYSKNNTGYFDTATTNPFVIGWGKKIANGFWVEIDKPFDWLWPNYFADNRALFDQLSRLWKAGYGGIVSINPNRVFVWCVALEFTVTSGIVVVRPRIPPPPREPVVPSVGESKFDMLGRDIPYSKGARRLEGAKGWAQGIEGATETSDIQDTAFGSWAEFFGRPLQRGEEIYLNRLWADGRPIWSDAGGTLVEELGELNLTVYTGAMDQEPDPNIVADKGAARTPAWRDFIYIVFIDVPLLIFGNRMPEIHAEFLRVDEQRIEVAEALEDVADIGGVETVATAITDMADGVVFNTMNPRGILEQYIEQYNYRIIDGLPVVLRRNEVNELLTIDRVLKSTEFVALQPNDPIVQNQRADDTGIANQITITYNDRSQDYQNRPQYARLPLFPVPVSSSRSHASLDTDFIITAVEALEIAYGVLYRRRAARHKLPFRLMPVCAGVKEGYVLSIPTGQGTFVGEVVERRMNPDLSQDILAAFMLPEDGAELTADAGDLTRGVNAACYYPQETFVEGQYASNYIQISSGRIITGIFCDSKYGIGSASTNVPRRLSHRYIGWVPMFLGPIAANLDYLMTVTQPSTDIVQDGFPPVEDWLYEDWVYRFDRANLKSVEILKFPPNPASPVGTSYLRAARALADDSRLYLGGGVFTSISSPEENFRPILTIVDLADFTLETVVEVVDFPIVDDDSYLLSIQGMAVSNGVVILVTVENSGDFVPVYSSPMVHRYDVSDGTLTSAPLDHIVAEGVAVGGFAYFMPFTNTYESSVDMTRTMGVKVDIETLEVEYFDITDDPNVISIFSAKPWADDTNLYFLANTSGGSTSPFVDYAPQYINAPYLASRRLDDLSVGLGIDLTFFYDNIKYELRNGAVGDGYHYLSGPAIGNSEPLYGRGSILKLPVDGAYGLFYPPDRNSPSNDNFPGTTISLGQTKRYDNESAIKQVGEPNHGGAYVIESETKPANLGGKSVWWTFVAPETARYVVTVTRDETLFPMLLSIYIGETLTTLTAVAERTLLTFNSPPFSLEFPAIVGERYRIVIDGYNGNTNDYNLEPNEPFTIVYFGRGTITITEVAPAGNDDFVDAFVLNAGSPDDADNAYATKEAGEPDHAGEPGGKSLWWGFTAPADGDYQFSTADATMPLVVAVYTGDAVGDLTEVASGADDPGGDDNDMASWMTVL